MDISIKKDDGSIEVYYSVVALVEHLIEHALFGMPPDIITSVEAMETLVKEAYAPETGACMCTSLSQALEPDDDGQIYCVICEHPVHNTRAHCGALR